MNNNDPIENAGPLAKYDLDLDRWILEPDRLNEYLRVQIAIDDLTELKTGCRLWDEVLAEGRRVEDLYQRLILEGVPDSDARRLVSEEVTRWRGLNRNDS